MYLPIYSFLYLRNNEMTMTSTQRFFFVCPEDIMQVNFFFLNEHLMFKTVKVSSFLYSFNLLKINGFIEEFIKLL